MKKRPNVVTRPKSPYRRKSTIEQYEKLRAHGDGARITEGQLRELFGYQWYAVAMRAVSDGILRKVHTQLFVVMAKQESEK